MQYKTEIQDAEKILKIKEIKAKFLVKVKELEKVRDEKIKAIKKKIDQRKINAILLKIKS